MSDTTTIAMAPPKDPVWRTALSGAQILFVAFGATVLVPLLTGLNPSLALLGAGIGTLVFQVCTRREVPIYLGSSFAFIAPVIYSVQTWGMPATFGALAAATETAGHQWSFWKVAQRPNPWRASVSISIFSRGPVDTTARPLVCTSIISFSAFSRL